MDPLPPTGVFFGGGEGGSWVGPHVEGAALWCLVVGLCCMPWRYGGGFFTSFPAYTPPIFRRAPWRDLLLVHAVWNCEAFLDGGGHHEKHRASQANRRQPGGARPTAAGPFPTESGAQADAPVRGGTARGSGGGARGVRRLARGERGRDFPPYIGAATPQAEADGVYGKQTRIKRIAPQTLVCISGRTRGCWSARPF